MKSSNLDKVKKFISKKRVYIPLGIVVALILYFSFFQGSNTANTSIETAVYTDLKETVLATGQATSKTDLNLSFNKSGIVKSIKIAVGDKVSNGQILANLDQGQALAELTKAKGAVASAQARYQKTIEGSSNEEISLAKIALATATRDYENVKNQQTIAVSNAYHILLSSTPEALPKSGTSDVAAPIISGTYRLDAEGQMNITVYTSSGFGVSGVASGQGTVSTTTPQPLGNSGLSIKFPNGNYLTVPEWIIQIPNKNAPDYLTNYNAYQSALKTQASALSTAQSLIDQRTAELAIKQASARQSDVDLAQADILSAQGGLQQAQASYEDTVIRAPASGTVTRVDVKLGELAQADKDVMTLEDISNMYIEANINESNIASLVLGQPVAITFDAFGKDKVFTGAVAHIDPSAQTNDGVVNYLIKVSILEKDATIRPGMNANIVIEIGNRMHVIAIPKTAVVKKDNKEFVNVLTNEKKMKYEERAVSTGFVGDGNVVEITSGLTDGEKVMILNK